MTEGTFPTTYREQTRIVRTNGMRVWVVVFAAVLAYLPWVVSQHSFFGLKLSNHALLNVNITQVNLLLMILVGALGLNLLTGYTGLISIGNAGFFSLGAIVAASIGIKWATLPFPIAVLIAGLAGAAVGTVVGLPSLRIRGIYLLLATLGLHFVMVFLFVRFTTTWFGFGGIQYSQPSLFGFALNTDIRWYYFLLGFAVISFLLVKNLLRSRHGRALVALRDHDIGAAMAGINVGLMRVLSFTISSFFITAIGACYVWYLGAASEDNFTLLFAIGFIAIIVIGGEGSLVGTVLGAVLWVLLPNALQALSEMAGGLSPGIHNTVQAWQSQITNIIFGVLIVVVIVFEPSGLNGIWRRLKQTVVRWPYTT
jgi:branched-chain amino acid transport system permease protein